MISDALISVIVVLAQTRSFVTAITDLLKC